MIKFRAWDKEINKYFEPTYQAYMGRLEELTIGLSGRLQKRTYRGVVDESVFPGRYVVEQFTGLKDVNGKDIYDGDIVSVFNEDGNYYNDVIEWCIKYNYPAFELKYHSHLYESNALSEIMNAGVENIKVIGNVHENPELLEADK
ncbi:YopX family protein [Lactiplantibacillus paraplantarum]|uniref:YopX family protein n=1 Tax=Lactiplantibacillus paraplantarum TaxID=60520 RepID=UPI0030797FC1